MTSVIMAVVYAVVSRSEVTGLSQPTQCQHVHDPSEDASRLLALEGVAVQRVEIDPFGGRVVHVVTADETAAACPSCGVFSTSVKERVRTRPRDVPHGTAPLRLVWHKTRWRCREPLCDRVTFTESLPQLPARSRLTTRLRALVGAGVAEGFSCVLSAALADGVSWPVAHIDGRTTSCVAGWIAAQPDSWKKEVTHVAIDLSASYAKAVRDALPDAVLVADKFHLVALGNQMLTEVRQHATRAARGRRGRKEDPEWAARRRLLLARERLTGDAFARLWNALVDAGEPGRAGVARVRRQGAAALPPRAAPGRGPRAHFTPSVPVLRPGRRQQPARGPPARRDHRDLVAGRARCDHHRLHQRPLRGLQPPRQAHRTGIG